MKTMYRLPWTDRASLRVFMMTALTGMFGLLPLPDILAQGTVTFGNNGATSVTNGFTGQRVAAGTLFLASLLYAPAGITDEDLFVEVGNPVGFVVPGIYYAGTRTTPNTTVGCQLANFQVRVWESSYGGSYEEALLADPQNGRKALAGKSNIVPVRVGNVVGFPCEDPGRLWASGLEPMTLAVVPEPKLVFILVFGLGILQLTLRSTPQ